MIADSGISNYEVDVLDAMLALDLDKCVGNAQWDVETERDEDKS